MANGVSQKIGCGVLQSRVEVGGIGVGGGLMCGGRGSSLNTPTQSPSSSLSASQLTLEEEKLARLIHTEILRHFIYLGAFEKKREESKALPGK